MCADSLALMIAMPIRGLSGYFTGQIVSDVLAIVFSLKKIGLLISNSVKRRPYIKSDGMDILKYLLPVAIMSVFGTLITVTEAFVIRHRLPDIESAAYYMISRFAEIGNYFGNAIVFVLFPLVSEQHERGSSSLRILTQAVGAIAVAGGLLSIVIYVLGDTLFMLTIAWQPYRPYVSHMAVLSMIVCIKSMAYCYMTHEMACNRFGCIYFGCGIYLIESVILYGLTGFNFFKPYVPVSIMNAIADFNPARLDFVLQIMLIFSLLILTSYMVNHLLEWKSVKERSGLRRLP
jgi:hypothetical protein